MAYVHARRDKDGNIKNYRLVVSDGLDWKGQQRRRYSTWTPPNPNMSEKQMEKQLEILKTVDTWMTLIILMSYYQM